MERYKVNRLERTRDIVVEVPGSKSITNRALLLAALSNGVTILKGTLFSDDSRHFIDSLKKLGFLVDVDETTKTVIVEGRAGKIPNDNKEIYVGSAGTAARFLTAMLALSGGRYTINASEQMKKRPMKPLFDVLTQLGAQISYLEEEYHLPVEILGREDVGEKTVTLDTNESTQYLSAMLMTGIMHKNGIRILVTGSRKTGSYVDITKKMMKSFGCELTFENDIYTITKGSKYDTTDGFIYQVEPDVSAACYFYALGAAMGIKTQVKHVHMDLLQGDVKFLILLKNMGCTFENLKDGVAITGPKEGKLKAVTADMKSFSDQALTMAAIAVFADGATVIENVGHIRKQESDRIHAIAKNLENMGIKFEEYEDGIKIYPGEVKPCEIETFEDHRVAMSFTITGLLTGGLEILNPMCCKKTFENFYEIIDSLYE